MSQAAETLDGWYSLHLFYVVDWASLRIVSKDGHDVLVTEFQSFLENTATVGPSKSGDQVTHNMTGQRANLLLWFLRSEMKSLNHIGNEFDKLCIAGFLIPTYSHVSVIELSNYLAGKPDEDPYENPHIKARLYPELPHSDYICFYPVNKRHNETHNWYMLTMEERQKLMYDHGMIDRKYAGKIKQFITGSVGFDDFEWGVTLSSDDVLQSRKIVYEVCSDGTTARCGGFGSSFVGHITNTNEFDQFSVIS